MPGDTSATSASGEETAAGAAGARRRAWWLLAVLLLAAVLVNLGGLHRLEHGDSILPVLVSLIRWTPFYWDQERYGMLVPLLAMPVRDPEWNLLVQRTVSILAGLAAVVLLARHVLTARDWALCGAVAVAGLLALPSGGWSFEYLADQPYGLSLALALAGLAVAEPGPAGRRGPGRLAAGLALVLLAHWVNTTIGVVLGFLALARAAEDLLSGAPARPVAARFAVDAGLLAAGLAAGLAAYRAGAAALGHTRRSGEGFVPLGEVPGAWGAAMRNATAGELRWLLAMALAAAAGVALLSLPALRGARREALARAAALSAAGILWFLLAAPLQWVASSGFHWRYVSPSLLLLHLAAASLLAEPLARAARLARPALLTALLAIPAAAVAAWGPPSLAGARADLAAVTGRYAEEVLLARCDLLTGDYWTVWPTLWRVEQLSRERGLPRRTYGMCHRANPTVPFWWHRPRAGLRVCRPRTAAAERESAMWLPWYGLWPLELRERWPLLEVFGVSPQAPAPPAAPPGG